MKIHYEPKVEMKQSSSQSILQTDSQNVIFKTPSVFIQPEDENELEPHINVGLELLEKTEKPSAGVLKAVLDFIFLVPL